MGDARARPNAGTAVPIRAWNLGALAVLLYTGARVEECARVDPTDITVTARTGEIRLHGKGDQVRTVPLPAAARDRISAWLRQRGNQPGPLWTGQRGPQRAGAAGSAVPAHPRRPLTSSGLTQVVLAAGAEAGIEGLRPHRLRHTYATRLRRGRRRRRRSKPSSDTPRWTPQPATSAPAAANKLLLSKQSRQVAVPTSVEGAVRPRSTSEVGQGHRLARRTGLGDLATPAPFP
ncbi:MAG: tyrosine-type recombinase/integrase [Frankiaceae bacterium]